MAWIYVAGMLANAIIGILAWRDGYPRVGVLNIMFIAMNGAHLAARL